MHPTSKSNSSRPARSTSGEPLPSWTQHRCIRGLRGPQHRLKTSCVALCACLCLLSAGCQDTGEEHASDTEVDTTTTGDVSSSPASTTSTNTTSTTGEETSSTTSAGTSTTTGTTTTTTTTTTGASSTTGEPLCGNGELDLNEECDDGNEEPTDDCRNCVFAHCGDGVVHEGIESCDDGNLEDFDGCTSQCEHEFTVFISSKLYLGNLTPVSKDLQKNFTGLERADAICQEMADDQGLGGTYRAWLSDTEQGPHSRFDLAEFRGDFLLTDHTRIARGWQDLTDGVLFAPINRDEYNQQHINAEVWSDTQTDGTPYTNTNCFGWTSSSQSNSGRFGRSSDITQSWTISSAKPCQLKAHLYCFQIAPATK